VVFIGYLLTTLVLFGEGGSSLLYSTGNRIGWALSPIICITLFNGSNIYQAKKTGDRGKAQTYTVIQLLFTVAYLIFVIIQLSNNNFGI
jgi:hypothetical protein